MAATLCGLAYGISGQDLLRILGVWAFALTFAREGADVVINGRDLPAMEEVCAEIEGLGRRALIAPADIRRTSEIEGMVGKAMDAFGRVDILVNNAGGALFTPLEMDKVTEEDWDKVVDTNLKGMFLCCKAVLPHMKAREYGRIVNISSKAGRTYGVLAGVQYVSAKAGVVGLTRQIAWEYGKYGITANVVAPGLFMSTERVRNLWASQSEEIRQRFMGETALGRVGQPQELAESVLFLASEDSSYVTGAVLDVNGGRFMG